MRESHIERAVCDFARDHGCMVIKNNGSGNRGIPDRTILKDGKALWLELKAPNKRPTKLQLKWMERLRAQGFAAEWTDDVECGKELIRDILLNN